MALASVSYGNGSILLWMLEFFLFVVWFWLLIVIFTDLFRDRDVSGGVKALWVILLILLPFIGILAYLIFRGRGMTERAARHQQAVEAQIDTRIREAAGTSMSPTDQIAQAKALLDSGAINQAEYEHLKAKALAR